MNSTTITTGRYWNVAQLAEHLGVPKTWVYDRTREDGPEVIPHLKFGKYVRFNPASEAFQTWLRNHEIESVVGSQTHQRLGAVERKGMR